MDLEQYRLYDTILCIDLKSFFASVECVERGKDPLTYPLVVADKERGEKTIVLAVSPYLKEFGVPSRCRLWEVKPKGNIEFEIAVPQMSLYIKYSYAVVNIYLKYVSINDLYVYSVDECFLDLTAYMKLYNKSAREIAKDILADIERELGLYATVGIGQNMVMAKFALDIDAKHMDDYIAEWNYQNFKSRLWKVKKLTDVWGIGHRMEKNLQNIGIRSMYQLAMTHPDILYEQFGTMGHELFLHAHCLDLSKIQEKHLLSKRKGYGVGQTLFRDYFNDEILVILYEQCHELAKRLRQDEKAAKTLHVSFSYSKSEDAKGISKQQKLGAPTSDARKFYRVAEKIFRASYATNLPVRRISLSVHGLLDFKAEQPSLFDAQQDTYTIDSTIDAITDKHGLNAIYTAKSLTKGANQRERNKMIGGHKA